MGSFISSEKCSQCGGVYNIEDYYKTGERYCFCQHCGKIHNHAIVRDKNKNFCRDENGKLIFEDVMSQGYGCMAIASKGLRTVYHIDKPIDNEIKNEYLKIIDEEGIDKDKSYLSMWDEEKNEVVALFGTLPKSYDELLVDAQTKENDEQTGDETVSVI